MKGFFVLIINLFLLTACSAQILQPTPTPSAPLTIAVCRQPFRDAIDWTRITWPPEIGSTTRTEWEEMMSIIIPQAIKAGEVFLNSCVDSTLPLLEQTERLDNMAELATVICPSDTLPPGWQEQSYSARVQLVNLDDDNSSELLLITRALNTSYGGDFRVVYDLNENTEMWHGTLVWPTSLDDYSSNEPLIRPLSIAGTKDQTLVLIEGSYWGADHTAKHIWVWQWEGNHLEVMLKIRLSDWCGPEWRNWEITKEGILVHATNSTERCEAREAILYYLEDGEFTNKTP